MGHAFLYGGVFARRAKTKMHCRGRACPARSLAALLPKNFCRGEHCSPKPVCLGKNLPGKGVAAPSWRATNGRPYLFNAIANSLQNGNISLPNLQSCVARTIIFDVRLSRTGNKCKKDPSGGYKQHEEQENHRRGDGYRYGSFSGCLRRFRKHDRHHRHCRCCHHRGC